MSVPAEPRQDSAIVKLITSNRDYVTDTETCEFTYEWKLKNSSQFYGKTTIDSPTFSSNYSDFNDEWILKIDPNFKSVCEDTYVSVELQLLSFDAFKNTSQLQTKCKISINDDNEITKEYNFSKCHEKITWDNYMLRSTLIPSFINMFIQNSKLKICCTITMSKKPTNNYSDVISTFDGTQQLSADLKKLLLNEQLSDVTIQVGQKSFHAIKGILAIRSPVFAAMFSHKQLKENQKNEVVIEDIEEDVFEEFLHFIYSGKSPNVAEMPMELLAVAEKYQVDGLKNVCKKIICGLINFDNVASLLVCSDRYNLEKLNEKCLEFMKKNLRSVLSNETFRIYKQKHPEIFVNVLEDLLLSANIVSYS